MNAHRPLGNKVNSGWIGCNVEKSLACGARADEDDRELLVDLGSG